MNFNSKYILFSDEIFKNSEHNFEVKVGILSTFTDTTNYVAFEIELLNLSEDFYNYQRKMNTIHDQSDLIIVENGFAPSFVPINMFSNIKNGYGIFAGYSITRDTIFLNILH